MKLTAEFFQGACFATLILSAGILTYYHGDEIHALWGLVLGSSGVGLFVSTLLANE